MGREYDPCYCFSFQRHLNIFVNSFLSLPIHLRSLIDPIWHATTMALTVVDDDDGVQPIVHFLNDYSVCSVLAVQFVVDD